MNVTEHHYLINKHTKVEVVYGNLTLLDHMKIGFWKISEDSEKFKEILMQDCITIS